MPTQKRARQKAARQQKKVAAARRARRRRQTRTSALVAAGAAVVILIALATTGAFSSSSTTTKAKATTTAAKQAAANRLAVAAGCPKTPKTRVNTLTWTTAPAMAITPTKQYTAVVKTTAGSFTISLDAKTAPVTVNNFVFLAQHDYYKCVIFHRVVPGFMDQTGDPTGTGSGTPGYTFANENVPASYATGDVAMANSGGTDSNGAQFFILVAGGATTLNSDLASGSAYSLFGTVTKGMSVVNHINSEGNATTSANGVPPKVINRMLSVTINES